MFERSANRDHQHDLRRVVHEGTDHGRDTKHDRHRQQRTPAPETRDDTSDGRQRTRRHEPLTRHHQCTDRDQCLVAEASKEPQRIELTLHRAIGE